MAAYAVVQVAVDVVDDAGVSDTAPQPPIVVLPELKEMLPVGLADDEETVAVKVTDWPATAGLASEDSAVEVGACSFLANTSRTRLLYVSAM